MGEARRRRKAGGTNDLPPEDQAHLLALFAVGYRNTVLSLDDHKSDLSSGLQESVAGRNLAIDQYVQELAKRAPAACAAGCSACCHQMVLCDPVEVLRIAGHLLMQEVGYRSRIMDRLRRMAALPLTADDRYGPDKPCPFLEERRCSIYAGRPRICRTVLSMSRAACEASLAGQDEQIPYVADSYQISAMLNGGQQHAFATRSGLVIEQAELTSALLLAVENFDEVASTWAAGGDPFTTCRPDRGERPSDQATAAQIAARAGIAR